MPTAIASDSARQRWTSSRLSGPEIQGESPSAVVVWPSSDIASFSVTSGWPVRACLRNGWLSSRAAVASSPAASSTSTPPSRSIPGPRPEAFSLGSSDPITTRPIPASRIASTHGGCRPVCAHGSSVTYIVAPAGSSPRSAQSLKRSPLGMQIPKLSVVALADHSAISHNDRSHQRIRADSPPPELRKLQSPPKMSQVRSCQRSSHH